MSKLMDWLRQGLSEIDEKDLQPPTTEVKDTDEVIGRLEDPELKKLSTFRILYHLEFAKRVEAMKSELQQEDSHGQADGGDHDTLTCKGCMLRREHDRLEKRSEFLDALFWTALKDELPEEAIIKLDSDESSGCGIRAGWQVVSMKEGLDLQARMRLLFGRHF